MQRTVTTSTITTTTPTTMGAAAPATVARKERVAFQIVFNK